MRNSIVFAILFSVITLSCDERDSKKTCGVSDPVQDLQWLKNRIADIEAGKHTPM
jgi:hypothetical protein